MLSCLFPIEIPMCWDIPAVHKSSHHHSSSNTDLCSIICFYYHYYRSVNQFLISKILPVQNKSISQWTLENRAGEGEETWELEGSKGHRALNFTQLASSFLPPCEPLKEGNEGPHSTFKGGITSFKVSKLPTIVFELDAKHCSVNVSYLSQSDRNTSWNHQLWKNMSHH